MAVFGQHLFLPFFGDTSAVERAFHVIERTPAYIAIAGHEAVIWFFLLSGFVLSLPHVCGERVAPGPFLIRRLCRVYLPYLVSLGVALACAVAWGGQAMPSLSDWFNHVWPTGPTWSTICAHLVFIGVYDSSVFNPVLWSLVQELRVSLLFPVLVLFWMARSARANMAWSVGIAGAGVIISRLLAWRGGPPELGGVVTVIGIFGAGFLLARHRDTIVGWYRARPPLQRIAFGLAGFVVYAAAKDLPGRLYAFRDLPIAAGAAMLTVVALGSARASAALQLGAVRFLGRVSYSFYLYHAIVIVAVLHAGYGRVPTAVLLAVAAAGSLLAAWASYVFVERPCMALGRMLTRAS